MQVVKCCLFTMITMINSQLLLAETPHRKNSMTSLTQVDIAQQGVQNQFYFKELEKLYLNNRQMGDENRYIYERQLQEHRAGLILEKPCLLLKRNYIQVTNFIEEKLNEVTKYEKVVEK